MRAAQRQARSDARQGARRRTKKYAPSHPLGKPAVSLAEACEAQQREAEEARRQLIARFWEIKERG